MFTRCLSLGDDREDLILGRMMRLEGDHDGGGSVAEEVVPSVLLLAANAQTLVQIEAVAEFRTQQVVKVRVMVYLHGSQPIPDQSLERRARSQRRSDRRLER